MIYMTLCIVPLKLTNLSIFLVSEDESKIH